MKAKTQVTILSGAALLALSAVAAAETVAAPPSQRPQHEAIVADKTADKTAHKATDRMTGMRVKPAASVASSARAPLTASSHSLILRENHLLSQDIKDWAKAQGLHPLWNSNRDYLIFSTIYLHGKNRDEVLDQLGQLFRSENYGLVIRLYEKNSVLVIDSQ